MGDDLGDDDFDLPINSDSDNEDDQSETIIAKGSKRSQVEEAAAEEEGRGEEEITTNKPKKKKKKKSKNQEEESNESPLSRDDMIEMFYSLYQKELTLKFVPAELNMGPKLTPSLLVDVPSELKSNPKLRVEKLPSFIKSCIRVPQHAQNNKLVTPGQPHVIIICSSALRCCALIPTLRKSTNLLGRSGEHVAKLFAKHQKVPEQIKELKKLSSRIVVGTPNRLHKLVTEKALRFDDCQLVLLDISERDSKNYSLLSLPGVVQDLMLFFKEHLLPATAEHKQLKFAFM